MSRGVVEALLWVIGLGVVGAVLAEVGMRVREGFREIEEKFGSERRRMPCDCELCRAADHKPIGTSVCLRRIREGEGR